jgi:hypothetical protein
MSTEIGSLDPATQGALGATSTGATKNFGVDSSCTTGIRSGVLVSGITLVAQMCFRRLSTPRGQLYGGEDEANFGLDLVGILGHAATDDEAASVPGQVQAELLKDARVAAVTCTTSSVKTGPAAAWTVNVAVESSEGAFSLVLSVDAVSVQLLGIAAGIST